jgi:anti-sigma-K factor RskA
VNEQENMTGAWALNALDAEERALVEEHLAQDAVAADEARSFEETAAELARGLEPVAPRPELKSALMARIAQTSQLPSLPAEEGADDAAGPPVDEEHEATVVPLDRYRASVRRTRWLAVAAATLMVTTVAGLGLWGTERAAQQEAEDTIAALQAQQATSDQEREAVSTILASGDVGHLSVAAEGQGTLNLLYSAEQGSMVVQTAGLPELPSDSTYQLWLIEPGADPADAGVVTDPGGSTVVTEAMAPGTTLALTIEPAGGSEQPTMTPIAQGLLS